MSQTRFRVILPGPIHNQFTKAREILTYFQSRTITRRNSTKQKRKIWFVNNFIMVVWTGMEQSRGYLHSEYRPLCRAFHQPINMRTCYQLHIRPQICVCSRAHRLILWPSELTAYRRIHLSCEISRVGVNEAPKSIVVNGNHIEFCHYFSIYQ